MITPGRRADRGVSTTDDGESAPDLRLLTSRGKTADCDGYSDSRGTPRLATSPALQTRPSRRHGAGGTGPDLGLEETVQASAGMTSSGYAGMPNSGTSRPSSSTSTGTRIVFIASTVLNTAKVAPNAHAMQSVAPRSWHRNWLASP